MACAGSLAVVLWLGLACSGTGAEITPITDCPLYVEEGADLDCECSAPRTLPTNGAKPTISWRGSPSLTSRLLLKMITRRDNGSTHVCEMVWKSQKYSTIYTLQVAYGPLSDSVRIEGPEHFVTDGTKTLTLTCIAQHVNPKAMTIWHFGPCNHGASRDNCTFQPDPAKHDGKTIICRAVNAITMPAITADANFTLRLQYPPIEAPEITGYSDRQIRRSGDKLTCTVTGGKPLVSRVIFNCTNPPQQDEDDDRKGSSVSSPLVINVSKPTDYETVCVCSAVWDPDTHLYSQSTTISFAVQAQQLVTPTDACGTTEDVAEGVATDGQTGDKKWFIGFWVLLAILVCVVIIAVWLIVILRRRISPQNPMCPGRRTNKYEENPHIDVYQSLRSDPAEKKGDNSDDSNVDPGYEIVEWFKAQCALLHVNNEPQSSPSITDDYAIDDETAQGQNVNRVAVTQDGTNGYSEARISEPEPMTDDVSCSSTLDEEEDVDQSQALSSGSAMLTTANSCLTKEGSEDPRETTTLKSRNSQAKVKVFRKATHKVFSGGKSSLQS